MSEWKNTPLSQQSFPICSIGWTTPISLLTNIILAKTVWGVKEFLKSSRETRPFFWTGKYVTLKPFYSSYQHESNTHLCSV